MFRRGLIALSLVLTLRSATAGVDLTPRVEDYTSQGIVYRKVNLKTDTGSVTFVPPRSWIIRGGKDRLQMEIPNKQFAEATITAAPLAAPAALDEAAIQALEQQALSAAPPSSSAVEMVRREENPVMGRNASVEFTISYVTLGHTFHRSVIFLYLPDTQLVFQVAAPKEDFDIIHEAFRRSINSWQWIEKKRSDSGTVSTPASG